ncbi:S41 family peptidase [Bacillus marinisedimentorum]|uniref:S41 family peptidase n=1 Tax=Bacillus marinisedimentorum TaxID=1821260 RepID=UPI0007E2099B
MKSRAAAVLAAVSLLIGAGGTYAGMTYLDEEQKPSLIQSELQQNLASGKGDSKNIEDVEKIEQTLDLISDRYVEEVDNDKLVEGAIQGMIDTLEDPYSVYMDKDTAHQFTQSLDSSFEGIGAEVSMVDGKVTIVAPFKDSPAEKAGLKPNDQILKVDGKSIAGLDLYEAVLKIRGEKGTTVTLEVNRPGVTGNLSIDVKRDEIPIETVYSDMIERDGKKIGILEVTSFSENTAADFKKELKKMEDEGIAGLVIDVRGNPGGYLESVEEMSRLIIPEDKPFVQIENRDGEKDRFFSTLKSKKEYPIVGLIDGGSASASEILAGALKEAGGYEIVGQKTFGKGTVQQAIPMEDGSNIKLTLFKWLTPDGNWIHKKGIEPTVEVKQPEYFYANPIQLKEGQVLEYDMNSEQVKNAQVMLKGLGFAPGRTDGYFNKQTETAVKAFQERNDLKADGKIDEKTSAKIQEKTVDSIKEQKNDLQLQTAVKMLLK